MKRLHGFSERIYRFVVEAMKEELTFDEPPDEFKGLFVCVCVCVCVCVLCVCDLHA